MNERHTFNAPLPPIGPSPSTPVNICWNIVLRNIDSKFSAAALGLALDLERGLRLRAFASPIEDERSAESTRTDARHHITSMSAWMAPAALIACRITMRSRGPMPSALRPSTICCSDTPSWTSASFLPSSCTPTWVRGTMTVRPRENGAGWLTCGDSEIDDGEIALRDRDRRHPHVAADDDHAGAFVDDDLGGVVRLDLQLLDLGEHGDHVLRKFLRQRELHGRRVERLGDRRADIVVDGDGDALGRREVGVAQSEPQLAERS